MDGDEDEGEGVGRDVAWVYVGSANLSESAWGKLSFDKKAKAWKINCRNWECGVLLPVPEERLRGATAREGKVERAVVKKESVAGEDSETESDEEGDAGEGVGTRKQVVGMEVFDGLAKPPFEYPGREYEGREPWYFQERMR